MMKVTQNFDKILRKHFSNIFPINKEHNFLQIWAKIKHENQNQGILIEGRLSIESRLVAIYFPSESEIEIVGFCWQISSS